MEDRVAVDKAASLMGVSRTPAGRSPVSGHQYWRATATCARAVQIIDLVKQFLTPVKTRQANRAIKLARKTGYRTISEMKEERKLIILKHLRLKPGSPPRRIRDSMSIDQRIAMRYLEDLEKEGKVMRIDMGPGRRPRTRWFLVGDAGAVRSERKQAPTILESASAGRLVGSLVSPVRSETKFLAHGQANGINTSKALPKFLTTNQRGRVVRKGLRGKLGGEIRLSKEEDRAWLGALVVGEGTTSTRKSGGTRLQPYLAIRMQDKDAVDIAATLMGVRRVAAGKSKQSGRRFWRAVVVGGRAIQVVELIKQFMTPAKIKQADKAILFARKTGFRTKHEMCEERKQVVEEFVRRKPGSFTAELMRLAKTNWFYVSKYLQELEKEGKVWKVNADTARRPRHRWFPAHSEQSS